MFTSKDATNTDVNSGAKASKSTVSAALRQKSNSENNSHVGRIDYALRNRHPGNRV